jgi:CRP-like cAMP-binding protein
MKTNLKTNATSDIDGNVMTGALAVLAEHPFLKGMNPRHLRLLGDFAMEVNFQPGQLIFREGEPANRFYLIRHGKVELESYVTDCGIVPIQTVGAGEVLGWSWLFPPYYWHFDARAAEPTKAIFFYGTPLREECETDHDLGYELLKRTSEVAIKRLQAMRKKFLDLNISLGH